MIIFKYVVNASRISIARVATGFFLPMILENLTDQLDIIITAMTNLQLQRFPPMRAHQPDDHHPLWS